jgi:hypothetical protein
VLEQHARRVITRTLLNRRLDEIRPQAEADAAGIMLPSDLRRQVEAALLARPDIPWDLATADIAQRIACAVDLPTINNQGETRHG